MIFANRARAASTELVSYKSALAIKVLMDCRDPRVQRHDRPGNGARAVKLRVESPVWVKPGSRRPSQGTSALPHKAVQLNSRLQGPSSAKSGPEHMQQEAPIADGIPVPPACRSIRARCWRQRARGCAPFHRAQCRWNGVSASRVDDLSRSRRDSNPILSAPLRESACRAAGPHRQTHGLVPWEARFPRRTQQ